MQLNLYHQLKSVTCARETTPPQPLNSLTIPLFANKQLREQLPNNSRKTPLSTMPSAMNDTQSAPQFGASLSRTNISAIAPQAYHPNLTPNPSPLHPHCLARDRLHLWPPEGESTRQATNAHIGIPNHVVSDEQLDRILEVIGSLWAQSTKEAYGRGLLVFHVYCDMQKIGEDKRCPITPNLLLKFLSGCTGLYSSSVLSNFVAALKAWHLLHGREWRINPQVLKTILNEAAVCAPESSKLPKRPPTAIDFITNVCNFLDLNAPLDTAIFACLTTTFYCVVRLGEFTVATIKDFNPKKHIIRGDVSEARDHSNLLVTKFWLPYTKSAKYKGEEAFWASQDSPIDPKTALENHLRINQANSREHRFVWRHTKGIRPLSKREFSKRLTKATTEAGLPDLKGHSLCIGGTLEYLLRGIPFDIVESMGH